MQGKILSVVKIMIFAIPFTILLNLTVAIYRGFDRTSVNMYFYNIIRPVSLLGFASAAVFLGVSLKGVVFADLLSMIFTFGIMSVYFVKRPPIKPEWKLKFSEPTKQLIRYSFPLLISATLLNLMTWTDTIMLGYFKSAEVVGIYNAVYPLVGFLSMIIGSMGFVYIPVTSKLWGENNTESLGPIYQIMTKWCFLLTFPVFALMFVYPEFLLTKIYGAEYASGATVLRILALGFVTNSYFGFNYHTIMASGDSDFLMKCSVASAGTNVLLNFMLIPQYGMVGAASRICCILCIDRSLNDLKDLEEATYASIHFDVQEVDSYRCLHGRVHACSQKCPSAFRSNLGVRSLRSRVFPDCPACKSTGRK